MKPTFLRTFSLRTLLIVLTMAAIGLAVVGSRLIEHRRQERLVAAARYECKRAGCLLALKGNPTEGYYIEVSGPQLSVPAARAIGKAELIRQVIVHLGASAAANAELRTTFHLLFDNWTWLRNGWGPSRADLEKFKNATPPMSMPRAAKHIPI